MRWMQLHLRDWFWLALVVGLILGWWLDHRRLAPYVPACHEQMTRLMSLYEALEDYGVQSFTDPSTQKVILVKTGMGKQR